MDVVGNLLKSSAESAGIGDQYEFSDWQICVVTGVAAIGCAWVICDLAQEGRIENADTRAAM
jgi:hypothetical protein